MIKKTKVLFVAEELATNGAMMSLLALLKALPKNRYDISLFLFLHGGSMTSQLPSYVHVLPESPKYAVRRESLKSAIKKSLKFARIDLLAYRLLVAVQRAIGSEFMLWGLLPDIPGEYDVACCYVDGYAAPLILHKVNARKKCSWVHVPYTNWEQPQAVYDALKQMDMCVVVSQDTGNDLTKVLKCLVPQHIIHNITDAQTCIERAGEPCEMPKKDGVSRIVSVGRVTPQKNFDIIPETARLLREKGHNFEWYVIGDGHQMAEIRNEISKKKLNDCVLMVGSRSNPMPWIKSADVVVLPSRFEAWGMTVSEALCLGKAVVTSDIAVFGEQISEGYNGLMRPGKPIYIAEAIESILIDDALRSRLESNATKYPFTKETIVKEFDNLMIKLGFNQ